MSSGYYDAPSTVITSVDANPLDVGMMEEAERLSPLLELGTTGLKRASGYIDEEFLPQLRAARPCRCTRR